MKEGKYKFSRRYLEKIFSRHDISPLQRLLKDIFVFSVDVKISCSTGVHYLLLVDEYSKWLCVARFRMLTSASVLRL